MKITVIVPVYNGSEYICRCLDSIKKQTFEDYSILIVDDGSGDDSTDIITKWKKENPRIDLKLICQENKGAAAARNYAISLVETEYTTFMDQDDTIAPDYLETYIQAIEAENADIVCGGYTHKYSSTKEITRVVKLKDTEWAKFVVVSPWAHLYRTAFLQSYPIRFLETKLGEDVYFSLMAYAYTDKIITIPDIGYTWTNNPASHSNKNQKKVQESTDPFTLLNALINDLPSKSHITNEQLEYYLYRYIIWYLLFTARQTSKTDIEKQYHRLLQWLSERFPNYQKNHMISLFGHTGEPVNIKLCVCGFNTLDRSHLMLLILKRIAIR